MKRFIVLLVPLLACRGERNPENSAICGLGMIAAANVVIEQFSTGSTIIETAPPGLTGVVPARVVGRGTTRALAAEGPDSVGMVVGYQGEGFPTHPGWAVALVDDSSEVFRGILVYDSDGPSDYPQIGTISGATSTLPLYGMRVRWASVSDERCPLFADVTDPAH